ncbi:hypothetical protein L596_027838 [Steinernema carpocapsae]|uniref:Uncharacterized protein n=1 Tax=Steinernema carpocapsae TaxID=34508 RepID=A0A4U5LWN9_STECR|nr:hypothetical protein L596_027838 [Steinernema carpocapsae]
MLRRMPSFSVNLHLLFGGTLFFTSIMLFTWMGYVSFSSKVQNHEPDLSSLLIATALSSNHYKEALKFCRSFKSNSQLAAHPKKRLVVYKLGTLNVNQTIALNETCGGAEFRKFPFDRYPSYVQNLFEYRWKPVILSEILDESDAVIYADSSTEFQNTNETFENLIKEIAKSKITMRIFGPAGHSIFRTTHPKMYSYLPIPPEKVRKGLY